MPKATPPSGPKARVAEAAFGLTDAEKWESLFLVTNIGHHAFEAIRAWDDSGREGRLPTSILDYLVEGANRLLSEEPLEALSLRAGQGTTPEKIREREIDEWNRYLKCLELIEDGKHGTSSKLFEEVGHQTGCDDSTVRRAFTRWNERIPEIRKTKINGFLREAKPKLLNARNDNQKLYGERLEEITSIANEACFDLEELAIIRQRVEDAGIDFEWLVSVVSEARQLGIPVA